MTTEVSMQDGAAERHIGTARADLMRGARGVLVAPSILASDFARVADEATSVLDAGGDLLHLDVMDGHFVPNLTMGPDMCRGLRKALPGAFLDVHLMVTDPGMFIDPFQDAGADLLTFHIEVEAGDDARRMVERIHDAGMLAGVALNPGTSAEALDPILELADLVLVMSVRPGFGGQSFMAEVLESVRAIRPRLRADQRLEMDGGVGPETASACREAGADVLVAGSAIFRAPDRREAIRSIRGGN